eukprot:scaffold22060_cov68-Phaeocystis_antarctica.AAC.10
MQPVGSAHAKCTCMHMDARPPAAGTVGIEHMQCALSRESASPSYTAKGFSASASALGRAGTKRVGSESNAATESAWWVGWRVGWWVGWWMDRSVGDGARLIDAELLGRPQQHGAHVGLERQLRHALPLGGEPTALVDGAEREEQLEAVGEALRRRRREELEAAHVVDAERLELQRHPGEGAARHLRRGVRHQAAVGILRHEHEAGARPHAPRPPRPLPRVGLRLGRDDE